MDAGVLTVPSGGLTAAHEPFAGSIVTTVEKKLSGGTRHDSAQSILFTHVHACPCIFIPIFIHVHTCSSIPLSGISMRLVSGSPNRATL